MIIYLFLLPIILSVEATIGLPLFFLYLSYGLIKNRSNQFILPTLFVLAFALSIFYSVSFAMMALLLVIFHLCYQKLVGRTLLQFALFALLYLLIFQIAKLQLNFFYLPLLAIFLFYLYKTNCKNYAS